MRLILCTALVLVSLAASSQSEPSDFGDIRLSDFNGGEYPDEPYVILFDKARFYYEWRGSVNYPIFERHLRVRINSREAFSQWGNYSLGSTIAEVTKVKAATYYVEGGKVVSHIISKDDIIKDKKSSNEKIFSLSNLREGAVIELSFTATFYTGVGPNWKIQGEAPVLWSDYAAGGMRTVRSMVFGQIEPAIFDKDYKGGTFVRWVFKNVPPFREETFMPAKRNYLARIEFFLPRENWTEVSKEYQQQHFLMHEKFQKRILKKTADELTAGMNNDVDKIKAVTEYIRKNFEWNGIQDAACHDLAKVFEKKAGTSGDLNILLHTMLQEAGLKPTLVLISTQSHGGVLKTLPSYWHFNNVLSKLTVGDRTYFLDATDKYLPFDLPPKECVNTEGFEMIGQTFEWINVLPPRNDKVNANARLTLQDDLSLKGRVTIQSHGYEAGLKRRSFMKLGNDDFVKEYAPRAWSVDSAKVVNHDKLDQAFQETYFATIPGQATETPERAYLDPLILLAIKENVWKDENRQYPIDFQMAEERHLVVTLTIPDTYKVESLPPNQTFAMPDKSMTCTFKITQSNNILAISYQFVMKKIWFGTEEYSNVRDFFTQVISRQNQPIVLAKNK